MLTYDEFVSLVMEMREANSIFLDNRDDKTRRDLPPLKRLERQVDRAARDYMEHKMRALMANNEPEPEAPAPEPPPKIEVPPHPPKGGRRHHLHCPDEDRPMWIGRVRILYDQGYSYKEIADFYGVSESFVREAHLLRGAFERFRGYGS